MMACANFVASSWLPCSSLPWAGRPRRSHVGHLHRLAMVRNPAGGAVVLDIFSLLMPPADAVGSELTQSLKVKTAAAAAEGIANLRRLGSTRVFQPECLRRDCGTATATVASASGGPRRAARRECSSTDRRTPGVSAIEVSGEGLVALVTGASSGLGRATALRLARDGARVAVAARSAGGLAQLRSDIEQAGGQALTLPLDLSDSAAIQKSVERVVATWGRVDVLVNAAGTDVPGSVEDTTVQDWDRVLNVNLRAPFLLSRAVLPLMRAAGGGTIINVSSVAGLRGWANAAAYCSSKFALTGLTQALAAEGRPHGIRVCVLYPGAMATSWGVFDPQERKAPPQVEQRAQSQVLPPSQVADLIAWIVAAPAGLALNQVTITPLLEQGWP